MPGMTMARLYARMKEVLRDLDLSFHEMDKVDVTVQGGWLQFTYNGKRVEIPLPPGEE